MLNYCLLPRSIIEISGKDNISFIQSIITQDIKLLSTQPSIFTLLLTNKGRCFLDFFIIKNNNSILVDISTLDINLFLDIINRYKLRAKIEVNIIKSLKVFSIFPPEANICTSSCTYNLTYNNFNNSIITVDNRIPDLGLRVITSNEEIFIDLDFLKIIKNYFNLPNIPKISLINSDYYTIKRYILAVPESTELLREKSVPLECNFDELNAISYNKGCYLGQEFTNASKRTLIIRKKIISFTLNKEIDFPTTLPENPIVVKDLENKKVGYILSIFNKYIMSLISIESIKKENHFFINNIEIKPIIPHWFKKLHL